LVRPHHPTQRAIRRGSLRSVKDLTAKIDQFMSNYNTGAKPFTWVATADSILAKIDRLCRRISGTAHKSEAHFYAEAPA
jgi:putative transposase